MVQVQQRVLYALQVGFLCESSANKQTSIEIFKFALNRNDKFVVIASDGIWEFLSSQEVAEIVYPHYENNDAEGAADALVKEAHKRWTEEEDIIDDITCIVIFLESIML